MERVSGLNKGVDHRPHPLVVLREDRLEDGEIKVGHLEDNLIEYVKVGGALGVLVDIKERRLQALYNHVIAIDNFLRQNHQKLVDFLVVDEPKVLQFKQLTREQILLVQLQPTFVVLRSKGFVQGHVLNLGDLGEVGRGIVLIYSETI